MRLLAKREVDQRKSVERARDIDEGMKLARQVDTLRETKAEEEASLARFRTESISKIHQILCVRHRCVMPFSLKLFLKKERSGTENL